MKKGLKIAGLTLLSGAVLIYAGFLFALPDLIDLKKFKPDVQKIVKEQTNLDINFENAKIITTPLLGAGVSADLISVKLPDGSVLFSAESFKTRISLPSLLLLTVKVSCLEIDSPFINLEIENDKNFKVVKLAEDLLNSGKEQKLEEEKQEIQTEAGGFQFNPEWIRIKIPKVKIRNYKVLVNDLKTKHFLELKGEKLALAYFNGKTAKIKTFAQFYSDENVNATANIDIDTFLPPPSEKLDKEDDPAERIYIPFVNPVTMYRNYDLKANLDTKLRVRNHGGNITSYGHCNIEGITLKVSNLEIPRSYIRTKTFGSNIDLETDLYPVKDQYIRVLGKLNYGRNPKMDMSVKTSKIQFNDLLILSKAFLESLGIQNELGGVKAEGYLNTDCYIKTNFKKLKSSGFIAIKDGGVSVRNVGKVLSDGNVDIKLDNNILDVRNSSVLIGNAPLYIDGKIDEKSIADINIKADKISLSTLFNAFAPKDIRENYTFKSGDFSIDFGVKGKLKKAISELQFGLENLNISDKALNIKNGKLSGEFSADAKTFAGKINNKNMGVYLSQTGSSIILPEFEVEIADNNILVKENSILLNDKTNLKYSGNVTNYAKLKSLNFITEGNINTNDLVKLIGKEFKPFIDSKGAIPIKLAFNGNGTRQTLFAQALCDKNNYITPINFSELQDTNTALQTVVDFKPNRIKIKKTGLFKRFITTDDKGNEIISLDEVLGIDGTIAGDRINLIKITMPEALNGKVYVFPQSAFEVKGKAFVLGEAVSPRVRGGFEIQNLSIPELLLSLNEGSLKFRGHSADFTLKDLILNGSDLGINGTISLLPSSVLNISNLDVKSRYMNLDKLMAVSEKALKYVPAGNGSSSSAQSDIPVSIQNGTIDFARIITGKIDVRNTNAQIALAKNIFFIRNLRTNVFDGRVRGDISMNLLSTLLDIKVSGSGVDVEKALLDGAGMKDTLSGKASFDTDISLRGVTYEEQMQSLKGKVNFNVEDGQFGPFGKLENLIIAENIRESQFFQTALGGVISGLTTIDTTHFSELIGTLSFNDGICSLQPITSLGNILSLHIEGDFDLLRNYADMTVRARMASLVSNLLGPLGAINPANLLNSAASLNVVTAKAFSIFCEMIPQEEMDSIPSFANKYVDNSATKFQLVVRGDAAKPLTLVKSFKWLATETEYQNAVDYVNSIPDEVEGSEAQTIEELINAEEAEKKTVKYKLKHLFGDKE